MLCPFPAMERGERSVRRGRASRLRAKTVHSANQYAPPISRARHPTFASGVQTFSSRAFVSRNLLGDCNRSLTSRTKGGAYHSGRTGYASMRAARRFDKIVLRQQNFRHIRRRRIYRAARQRRISSRRRRHIELPHSGNISTARRRVSATRLSSPLPALGAPSAPPRRGIPPRSRATASRPPRRACSRPSG